MRTIAAGGLAVLAVAGLWWNSLRPDNCYRRARQALARGDGQSVLRESRRLIAVSGQECRGRLLLGLLLTREEQFSQALPELRIAAGCDATAIEALTAAAQCLSMLGRHHESIGAARAALERDTTVLEARRWLAASYYDLGATVDAVAELKIIAAQATDDPRPERLLGLIAKDNERFSDAISHYRESLRRDPQQADRDMLLVQIVESQLKLNRFEEAEQALRDCDRTPETLALGAECAEGLGRMDEAMARVDDALKLHPQWIPALLRRGVLLLGQGHADDAAIVLEQVVLLAPHHRQARFHLAQAYHRQGALEQVDEQLQRMQEILAAEREFTEFHDLASEKPFDPEVRYHLGVLALKLGKPDLARMWFRTTLSLAPAHDLARAALERLEDLGGQEAKGGQKSATH